MPLAMLLAKALPPDVTPYKACFGLFRDLDMRRWSWYSLSSVAAASPLDMLPVNLAMLSEKPKTDFLTKLEAPFAMPIPSSWGLSVITKPWYGS